ncbi:MAG: hypothetical protein PHW66_01550 [Gallionella sp.]|nr:hypothetical protein [Gallionella sp.]
MRFSERYGYKKVREIVQIDSIDEPLRNALWSLLKIFVWDHMRPSTGGYGGHYLSSGSNKEISSLCKRLWFGYFKKPLDQLDDDWDKVYGQIRKYFFGCEWYAVYDFLEFVVNNYERYQFKDNFIASCNQTLEKEISAYRFVDGLISRITEQDEVDEIERALETALGPVRIHLRRALELLSSREAPDYRNSIKESISAVESLAAIATGAEKGTLGQLIKKLEDEIQLHPSLRAAFSSLYGYTSDEGGIRHALMESESVQFEDAKFFLVVCSAFVNFVEVKVAKPVG